MKEMIAMKHFRIMMAMVIFIAVSVTAPMASAQRVQVSDLGAARFVENINFYGKRMHPPALTVSGMAYGGPHGSYVLYSAEIPKVNLYMFCNGAGYVSRIDIVGLRDDKFSRMNFDNLFALSLKALGLSKSEGDVLLGKRFNEKHHSDVWCNATNRRIVVREYPYKNEFAVMITAYDR